MQKSPMAPEFFPAVLPVNGVKIAAVEAGIKYKNRTDVALFALAESTVVAGVFTRSKTASSAVHWSKARLEHQTDMSIRGIIVNSGNANAFTGQQGEDDNKMLAKAAAKTIGCAPEQILTASTGVIGQRIKHDVFETLDSKLKEKIDADSSTRAYAMQQAAEAIMTTDTFAKGSTTKAMINGKEVVISGIAKGSGMIAPDMATMLGFIFTDANIEPELLQTILKIVTDNTFNCITVDSDTSTSDTVLLAATGKADDKTATTAEECVEFIGALTEVMRDLAIQIVKDGEGASKLITINVQGAENNAAAKVIGMSIANSPLVKTAIAGEDANWGRVVMAVGKAGEAAERDKLIISMGGVQICADGKAVEDYNEDEVTKHLKSRSVTIDVDLQLGEGQARVWTCDFTERYIQINADYRS